MLFSIPETLGESRNLIDLPSNQCSFIHSFQQYIWPCFIIWGLDRFIRLARVAFFNFSQHFSSSRTSISPSSSSSSLTGENSSQIQTHASIKMLSTHCIQVTIPRPNHFHWSPGQTAILTIPSLYHIAGIPLEAHPFTIASFDSSIYARDGVDVASSTVDNSKKEKGLGESQDRDPFSHDVVFLINAHKGFTHRLALAASANNEPTASVSVSPNENAKEASVKVFVDGPYGITPDLTLCDTVVLIAGRFHLNFFRLVIRFIVCYRWIGYLLHTPCFLRSRRVSALSTSPFPFPFAQMSD